MDFCCFMANKRGKTVIAAGLDADFLTDPFVHVCLLVAKAESVTKIYSRCDTKGCDNDALFSAKKESGDKTNRYEVGKDDKYSAKCRKCYYKKVVD